MKQKPDQNRKGRVGGLEIGVFMFGFSLFSRFSVSTVGPDRAKRLQPVPLSVSGQPAMSLPTEINAFTKC